jgi:hypothetical protein
MQRDTNIGIGALAFVAAQRIPVRRQAHAPLNDSHSMILEHVPISKGTGPALADRRRGGGDSCVDFDIRSAIDSRADEGRSSAVDCLRSEHIRAR